MFPTFLLNPWVILCVITTLAASCTTGYVAGRKHEANSWKAEEANYLKALNDKERRREAEEYRMAQEASKKDAEIEGLHRRLNDEVRKATRGTACLGSDATSVWNRAFDSIRSLPEGSGRVPERSSVSDTAWTTDTEVLGRANEIAEILNKCRQQIDNIRRWNEAVNK